MTFAIQLPKRNETKQISNLLLKWAAKSIGAVAVRRLRLLDMSQPHPAAVQAEVMCCGCGKQIYGGCDQSVQPQLCAPLSFCVPSALTRLRFALKGVRIMRC